jgi:formate/nitrite transporter FocA (FNT family)
MSMGSEFRRTWMFWLLAVVFLVAGLGSLLWGFSVPSEGDTALMAHAERVSTLSLIGFALGELAGWVVCLKIVSQPSRSLLRRSMLAVAVVALLQLPLMLVAFTLK